MNILIRAFGCTANFGEAVGHMKTLEAVGHGVVGDAAGADAALVQTCCVIERTERNMIKEIKKLRKAGLPVIVSGCMSVARRNHIEELFPGILFLTFGKEDDLRKIVEELERRIEGERSESDTGGEGPLEQEGRVDSEDTLIRSNTIFPAVDDLSTTHIQVISNGCLGNCSYCITRLARGSLRSYPREGILREVGEALKCGKKEIFITSQDNAVYGFDHRDGGGGRNDAYLLPSLLRDLIENNTERDFRVRVGMMNPWGLARILDEFIPVMKDERIYSFLHLPVQSGDDDILRSMGRRYTAADYIELVEQLRDEIKELTVSTDVIVGYPGETDECFRRTVELIERVRPEVVNITRFSPRPGTRAWEMTDRKIPGWRAKNRSRELTRLRFEIAKRRLRGKVGKNLRALSVERGLRGSTLLRTDEYTTVVVKDVLPLGAFYEVAVVDSTDIYVVGEIRCGEPEQTSIG